MGSEPLKSDAFINHLLDLSRVSGPRKSPSPHVANRECSLLDILAFTASPKKSDGVPCMPLLPEVDGCTRKSHPKVDESYLRTLHHATSLSSFSERNPQESTPPTSPERADCTSTKRAEDPSGRNFLKYALLVSCIGILMSLSCGKASDKPIFTSIVCSLQRSFVFMLSSVFGPSKTWIISVPTKGQEFNMSYHEEGFDYVEDQCSEREILTCMNDFPSVLPNSVTANNSDQPSEPKASMYRSINSGRTPMYVPVGAASLPASPWMNSPPLPQVVTPATSPLQPLRQVVKAPSQKGAHRARHGAVLSDAVDRKGGRSMASWELTINASERRPAGAPSHPGSHRIIRGRAESCLAGTLPQVRHAPTRFQEPATADHAPTRPAVVAAGVASAAALGSWPSAALRVVRVEPAGLASLPPPPPAGLATGPAAQAQGLRGLMRAARAWAASAVRRWRDLGQMWGQLWGQRWDERWGGLAVALLLPRLLLLFVAMPVRAAGNPAVGRIAPREAKARETIVQPPPVRAH